MTLYQGAEAEMLTEPEMLGKSEKELWDYIYKMERLHKSTRDEDARLIIAKSQTLALLEIHGRRD